MNRDFLNRLLPQRLRKPAAQSDILDSLPKFDDLGTSVPAEVLDGAVAPPPAVPATDSSAVATPADISPGHDSPRRRRLPIVGGGRNAEPAAEPRKRVAVSRRRKEERAAKGTGEARSGDYQVLAHPSATETVVHRKVLVCGDCVMATLDPTALATATDPAASVGRMVQQPSRPTSPPSKRMLGKRSKPLLFAVDHRLFERQRTRYAFATDAYLGWGLKYGKNTTVLFGGAEDGGVTYLDAYVFQDRVLVEVQNRELPSHRDARFTAFLTTLLEAITERYPQARVVASAPLPDWQHPGIEFLGSTPLKSLRFAPISVDVSSFAGTKSGGLIAAAGLAVYAGSVGVGWNLYSNSVTAYRVEAADPQLQKAGGISNTALEVMQQQRLFMEAGRPQLLLAQRSQRIVAGVAAVPGVRIITLTFHAGASGKEPGPFGTAAGPEPAAVQDAGAADDGAVAQDVSMVIAVPASGEFAMEQARTVMQHVGGNTSLTLRLAPGGANEDASAGTRTFTIQGFLK